MIEWRHRLAAIKRTINSQRLNSKMPLDSLKMTMSSLASVIFVIQLFVSCKSDKFFFLIIKFSIY